MIKKITAVILFLSFTAIVNAQNFRFDFLVGGAKPIGEDFEKSTRFGLGYCIDVTYAPDILDNQLSFGLSRDGNILLSANASVNDKKVELKASKLGLRGFKTRFDLKTDGAARPYAAITLGCGRLKCGFARAVYNGTDEEGVDAEVKVSYETSNAFAVKPELGVSFGWFEMSLGWILPRKYGKYNVIAGAMMYNLGVNF